MGNEKMYEAGWLKEELEAAVKEVDQWSPTMRRYATSPSETSTGPQDNNEKSGRSLTMG